MKEILGAILVVVTVMFAMLAPFVTYTWYEHTQWVQEMVAEDIEEFKDVDVDWILFNTDPEVEDWDLRQDVLDAVLELNNVFSAGISAEQQAYKDAMYDVVYVLARGVDDLEELERLREAAHEAQIDLYVAAEVFTSNTIYAMRFTF